MGFQNKTIKYFLPNFAVRIYHKINEKRLREKLLEREKMLLEEQLENEKRLREELLEREKRLLEEQLENEKRLLEEILEEDWDHKNINYMEKNITIHKIYEYIDEYCKIYSQKDKNYYTGHAFRYFLTLYYVIKYNLYTGRILQVDDATSFFTYLLKNFLEVDNVVHLDTDLRKPVELYEDKFDVIICMEVFEHIIDADAFGWFTFNGIKTMLNSFWELLNENGKLLITTPNSCGVCSLSNLLHSINPLMFMFHAREYTPYEIKQILQALNYEIDVLNTEYAYDNCYDKIRMLKILKTNYFDLKHRGDDIFIIARKPPMKIFNTNVNINDILLKQ